MGNPKDAEHAEDDRHEELGEEQQTKSGRTRPRQVSRRWGGPQPRRAGRQCRHQGPKGTGGGKRRARRRLRARPAGGRRPSAG
eukprot:11659202-Alexandrium_andersonii.AAC.1